MSGDPTGEGAVVRPCALHDVPTLPTLPTLPAPATLPALPVHIVVLAKAPLPGLAKTRLVPALGVEGASKLALRLLQDALARVQAACLQADGFGVGGVPEAYKALGDELGEPDQLGWREWSKPRGMALLPGVQGMPSASPKPWFISAELCGAPAPDHADWQGLLPASFLADLAQPSGAWCTTEQGEGDLGQRMARASQRVTAAGSAVLLVGTDCPTLSPALLRLAVGQLQHHPAVLLPASDGGYVALGLRQHCPAVFDHMPWSTADVARLTVQRLQAHGLNPWLGPTLDDVDEPADLERLPPL